MRDPFDRLREELVAAAEREDEQAAGATRRRRWGRGLLLTAGTAVVTSGVAAAAILTFTGEDSKPLAGRLSAPTGQYPNGYSVQLTPWTEPGRIGWCIRLGAARDGRPTAEGLTCFPATAEAPVVASGLQVLGPDEAILVLIVTDRVAGALLAGDRAVLATPQPDLPQGLRAIAALLPTSGYSIPTERARFTLVDDQRRPIAGAPTELTEVYQDREPLPVTRRNATAASGCDLRAALPSQTQLIEASAATRPTPGGPLPGNPFLSCARATAVNGGSRVGLVLLQNEDGMGDVGPIAGSRPVPGHDDVVEFGARLLARRTTGGWLVAERGARAARLALLDNVK